MTTTYDTELNRDTVAAPAVSEPTESHYTCYDDPDTYTISAAWASSPLGEPDDNINDSFEAIEAVDEPKSPTSRAALAAALAAGIIGGATLGAVLFGYADPGQPSFVVPWGAVKTSPSQEIATPSSPPASPKPAVSEQKTNQDVVPAPGTPPVSAPPVIVDVFIPPLPPLGDLPEHPAPEPPDPEPPTFDPPNIDVVQVPQLDPIPPKGQLNDDLLSKPQRIESLMPDDQKPQLQRQSEPNSSRFNAISKP